MNLKKIVLSMFALSAKFRRSAKDDSHGVKFCLRLLLDFFYTVHAIVRFSKSFCQMKPNIAAGLVPSTIYF